MPLNDHPTAKPTYDFYDTVNAGKTAIANGRLLSTLHHRPNAQFPGGSTTWHWRSPAPIASYLVENSVGAFDLTWRDASDGIRYYEAQSSGIDPAQKQANLAIMNQQQDITDFQSPLQRAVPVQLRRRTGRHSRSRVRRGDADHDHLPRWSDRPRHLQPREHAPVVG